MVGSNPGSFSCSSALRGVLNYSSVAYYSGKYRMYDGYCYAFIQFYLLCPKYVCT